MRGIRVTQAVLIGSAAVIGGLIGLATNAASDPEKPWPWPVRWIQDDPWWAMLVLVGVAVGRAIVLEGRSTSDRTDATRELTMAEIADRLAVAISKQWHDEAQWRRLNDPHPLPVAWHPADLDVIEPWHALRVTATGWPGGPPTDPAGWAANPAELAGADNDLADRLARIPTGRLIVLGEPGAGKTMLLLRLVLELVARRQPGDPVPVLVPLAGWNPVEQDLPTWLVARLTVEHPGLAAPAPPQAGATSRARALWDQRLLLPILDGLDELPETTWSRAITRLNDALPPRQGLVLASRLDAYRQAVAPTDPAADLPVRLWGAAGISLRPLAPEDVRAYLRRDAASHTAAARWDPVLATLGTSTAAAQALTTPLLVSLARTIYNPRPGEHISELPKPADLCDPSRFPTDTEIQEHLFDGFIPAAYRPHPDPARRCAWTPEQAERWLVFLARHLEHDRQGATDLAWWELRRAVPRPLPGLAVGLVGGLVIGLAVGLLGGLAAGPRFGLVVGLAYLLVGGLVVGLPAVVLVEKRRQSRFIPASGLRWVRPERSALVVALVSGPAAALVVTLVVGRAAGLTAGLVYTLTAGLMSALTGRPADLTAAAEPLAGLARDRSTFWAFALVFGLGFGLVAGLAAGFVGGLGFGFWFGLRFGLLIGLVAALLAGLVFGLVGPLGETAWGAFVVARCWLALRHRLPWRLMSFLADAHQQRGVLRQAGAVYQFRHADFQHRLATRPTASPTG
jgi:MFS family permease